MPFNNDLFYTDVISDFNLTSGLISEAIKGLNLNSTLAHKVLAYNASGEASLTRVALDLREAAARLLNVQSITIRNHIDS